MKLYEVKRHYDDIDWDEYDSVMVLAEDEEGAIKHATKFESYFGDERVTVKEINMNKEGVIHTSFCAG